VWEELITQSRYSYYQTLAYPPSIHHSISWMNFVQPIQTWEILYVNLSVAFVVKNIMNKTRLHVTQEILGLYSEWTCEINYSILNDSCNGIFSLCRKTSGKNVTPVLFTCTLKSKVNAEFEYCTSLVTAHLTLKFCLTIKNMLDKHCKYMYQEMKNKT
jgi:hypothetical protein